MKLRQTPDDFKVDEISDIMASSEKQAFGLYILEKRGLDTFTLLAYLSKKLKVPYADFGFAGLKDRHAVTRQYITVPASYGVGTVSEQNFRLEHIGYVPKAIDLGDLKANSFVITVRDLKRTDLQGIHERVRDAKAHGIPNYFDSQRFGSVIHGEFIGKHVLKGDIEKAVRIYLTAFTHSEKAKIKADKKAILENWADLEKVRPVTGILAKVIDVYRAHRDWTKAFKAIPRNLREIYMSAYQSYIWNECIKAVLASNVRRERLFTVRYDLGELVFYKRLDEKEMRSIPATFKTVSHKMETSDYEGQVLGSVLKMEGLSLADFNIKKRTGYFFKVYDRAVIVRPEGLALTGPDNDELNKGRSKLTLSFTLQKGSYATVITKRIFKR